MKLVSILKEIALGVSPQGNMLEFVKTNIKVLCGLIFSRNPEDIVYLDPNHPYKVELADHRYDEDEGFDVIVAYNTAERGPDYAHPCLAIEFTLNPDVVEGEGPVASGQFIQFGSYKIQYITMGC